MLCGWRRVSHRMEWWWVETSCSRLPNRAPFTVPTHLMCRNSTLSNDLLSRHNTNTVTPTRVNWCWHMAVQTFVMLFWMKRPFCCQKNQCIYLALDLVLALDLDLLVFQVEAPATCLWPLYTQTRPATFVSSILHLKIKLIKASILHLKIKLVIVFCI